LLYALGSPEVSQRIVAAHDAAVAFAYLEREAGFVRRGHGRLLREPGAGLVGAAFRHRTPRATDPQLHTHVLLADLSPPPTTNGGPCCRRRSTGTHTPPGTLYCVALRDTLSRELGVA
jgi:hypothetical protein